MTSGRKVFQEQSLFSNADKKFTIICIGGVVFSNAYLQVWICYYFEHVPDILVEEEPVAAPVRSKWELVDYGNDTSDEEEEDQKPKEHSSVSRSQPQ